jgi:hypothetical protein
MLEEAGLRLVESPSRAREASPIGGCLETSRYLPAILSLVRLCVKGGEARIPIRRLQSKQPGPTSSIRPGPAGRRFAGTGPRSDRRLGATPGPPDPRVRGGDVSRGQPKVRPDQGGRRLGSWLESVDSTRSWTIPSHLSPSPKRGAGRSHLAAKSFPGPGLQESSPRPARNTSLPLPPMRRSLPAPPFTKSSPIPPATTSPPLPPDRTS